MDIILQKLAGKISSETGHSSDIMLFGLGVIWNFVAGYTVLIVASLLLGLFPCALIAALATSVLRIMSGGAHASSSNRCIVYGTIVFLTLGYLAKQLEIWDFRLMLNALTVIIMVTGIPIIHRYASSSINGKPLGTFAKGRKFRNVTIIFLILWAIVELSVSNLNTVENQTFLTASILGIAYQLFSLTPLGYSTVSIVDRILSKIHI